MIAVIADDLTGATEIGGIGWRHGLRAQILLGDEPPPPAEFVVYNTDSRNCSAAEASRRVARIAHRLKTGRAAWVYKKVDSVLRGNVLAEIRAAQQVLGLHTVLLVPANPSVGRTIRNGCYYVQGRPINQTDFRNDPNHPRVTARLRGMLGAAARPMVRVQRSSVCHLPAGLNVGQASTPADLQHWARVTSPHLLLAGGADFFTAILRQHGLRPSPSGSSQGQPAADSVLFVSGSSSESSIAFLERFAAGGNPVYLLPRDLFDGRRRTQPALLDWAEQVLAALRSNPKVAMGIGLRERVGPDIGEKLVNYLTSAAVLVIRKAKPPQVCAEGGATGALLLRGLGFTRLKIVSEFAMGVTGVRPVGRAGPLLVFKPGSYPWPVALGAGGDLAILREGKKQLAP